MKATVIISLVLACLWSNSRAQKLQFTFDTAGNQIARTWICTTCPASRADVKPNTLTSNHRDTVRQETLLRDQVRVSNFWDGETGRSENVLIWIRGAEKSRKLKYARYRIPD